MNGSLNFPNFDAGISKIELKPKNIGTKVVFSVRQYDPALEKNRNYRLTFNRVAAADFRINYFDNLIGAEAMGLYELTDPDLKEK